MTFNSLAYLFPLKYSGSFWLLGNTPQILPFSIHAQTGTGLVFIPGYEQYVRNAQGQLPNVIKKCAGFEWPVEATSPQERLVIRCIFSAASANWQHRRSPLTYRLECYATHLSLWRAVIFYGTLWVPLPAHFLSLS